jgi:hypothetical protein
LTRVSAGAQTNAGSGSRPENEWWMLPEETGPFSPELVLVCPELRVVALRREQDPASAAPRPDAPVGRRPAMPPARRSATPFTMLTLATAFAIGAYLAGHERGRDAALREAVDSTPSATVLGVPARVTRATSESRSAAPSAGVTGDRPRAATPSAGKTRRRTSASGRPPAPRVVLSADGVYVTSLEVRACPGAPKLPWLLVSDGRFAWKGELDGFTMSVAGRLSADDRVRGTATYRGRGCARTITYGGKASRDAR